ncbi:MAG: CopD family protein [Roseateles asaccharophilus]|uniref:Putative membrane protein n=1 Tax=Roseateles asaccharophilus TaxID=582607 RepID=A0A4R6N8T3_9BURK|nr:CopD family protein [Roseateles asaccharophilus]MDN3543983.1 CopD family protein [Roseateles asaccharophilus]TDP11637.1 putative membrane protein [Roseateles asaccharophilus]
MLYATLKTIHLLSIIVWIGGMVFAHFFLRPAVAQLEPPLRLRLMHEVLGRFFNAVLAASLLTLGTGVWMLGRVAKQVVQSVGSFEMPLAWTLMATLGVVMVAIFMHIRFALFKRLGRAVAASEWEAGGRALAQIRTWVSVNLGLGVLVLLVTLMPWRS